MPPARFLSRRRLGLALAVVMVAVLGVVGLLAVWERESRARATYDRIEVGMSREEINVIMSGWGPRAGFSSMLRSSSWGDPDGAMITVYFDMEGKVKGKHLQEADQSFMGKMKRLVGRPFP
jgi:hypothetical protein